MDAGQRKFAERMIAELRRQGVEGAIELDEEQFSLHLPHGRLMLGNAYTAWQRAPRLRRGRVLRHFAAIHELPDAPASIDEARPNLMPRVRDLAYYPIVELQFEDAGGVGGPKHSFQPLNDVIAVEIVYDHAEAVSTIGSDTLEGWGITFEEALRTARANLRERTGDALRPVVPGVHASFAEDSYDASRLLLTELITRLDMRGDPVAIVPHRDHLLITGSDDEAGLTRIAELAEAPLAENHRLTGRPVMFREGRWQPFAVPSHHPAADQLRRLELLTEAADYADQQRALQRRVGEEVYVASLMIGEDDHGGAASYCSWTEGVPSLLPRADYIAFVTPGKWERDAQVLKVPWDDAVEIVGSSMRAENLSPERWRVDTFPDEEQLRVLAAQAA